MRRVSTKIAEKVVKMIEPTIALIKGQQSPKPQKKTYSSTNDLIIPSLRKEPLSEQEMKQKEFKIKQRDQELKEMDYALKEKDYELKKKQTMITRIGLAAPAVTAGIAYQNLKNNVGEKDKEAQVNKLKAQVNKLKAQDAKSQAELNRYKKREEERLKQSENSLYNKIFGSGRK